MIEVEEDVPSVDNSIAANQIAIDSKEFDPLDGGRVQSSGQSDR